VIRKAAEALKTVPRCEKEWKSAIISNSQSYVLILEKSFSTIVWFPKVSLGSSWIQGMRVSNAIFIVSEVLFVVFFIFCVYHLTQKPNLPYDKLPIVSSGVIQSLNKIPVNNENEIEFLCSKYRIGDVVEVTFDGEQGEHIARVALVRYYDPLAIVVHAGVSLIIFCVGLFVYYTKKEDHAARVFYHVSTLVALTTVGVKTIYAIEPVWFGYILCLIFFFSYSFLSVLFLHFSETFPRSRIAAYRRWLVLVYGIAAVLWFLLSYSYLSVAAGQSIEGFHLFTTVSSFHYAFVFLTIAIGIGIFYRSYSTAQSLIERKKLRWILFGLVVGSAPFLFFWVLPQIFGPPWISETAFIFLLLIIPITFAISIVRYRLMDIDVVLNRSVVYGIVIASLLVVYALLIGGIASVTHTSSPVVSAVAAVVIALLFEPMRKKVQLVVDRKFFRVQYNYREVQKKFFEEIKNSISMKQLADIVVRDVIELLPPTNRLELLAHQNFNLLDRHAPHFEKENLRASLQHPIAVERVIEPGVQYEKADTQVFQRWGMALVLPLVTEQGEILGFLVLGEKKSQQRFSIEDVDLLRVAATQVVLAIERIHLQQKLALEHAEAERLAELNRLKSYFVSSVSHDLKTPLTSIKMFAELLKTKKRTTREKKEYLDIIEGETERLSRLINNVLDFAKIERGVQEYRSSELNLNHIVRNVLTLMQYQLKIGKCTIHKKLSKKALVLQGDEDAIARALINLLTNAMKYSPKKRNIHVSTFALNGFVGVSVRDEGLGIPEKELQNIFDAFYRVKSSQTRHTGGVGLGLSVVKNIMDAHGGKIEINSEVDKGSTFTLLFPHFNSQKESTQ
jgi:signal transduction histidine kinase